jgi:hypothetical protein
MADQVPAASEIIIRGTWAMGTKAWITGRPALQCFAIVADAVMRALAEEAFAAAEANSLD